MGAPQPGAPQPGAPEPGTTEAVKPASEPKKATPAKGPLTGLRVLDLTRLYPGPLGTMMLADMGAEVIKIEDREKPDYMRHYPPLVDGMAAGFAATNRGKRSLALKLATPEAREIIYALAETADVFVEGFRPGVLAKLGLDYASIRAVNPRIVYVSVTGYGQDGPYAKHAGHDLNYLGYAGILDTFGTRESGPISPGVQLADVAGGS